MSAADFTPGDVVRVRRHNPHGTYLLAGDEVTVAEAKRDTEGRVVLIVDTDQRRQDVDDGRRALYAADVEIVRRAYRPAEPDTAIDATFGEMLALDAELIGLLSEADIALGAVDDDLSDALDDDDDDSDDEDDDEEAAQEVPPPPGVSPVYDEMTQEVLRYRSPDESDPVNVLTLTDAYGDHAVFSYQEAKTSDGTVVATRVLLLTDYEAGGISIEARWLPDLIGWLHGRMKRAQRSE